MSDPASKKIYWLTDVAGAGKTTVAQSVAHMDNKPIVLGATFRISHTSKGHRSYNRVITTLAAQLAQDARFCSHITAAILADGKWLTANAAGQAQKLLFDVLRTPMSDPPSCLLIVLDALDEYWKDVSNVHDGDLLPILLTGLMDIPFVKVLLTSRPEPGIEAILMDESLDSIALARHFHQDIQIIRSNMDRYLDIESTTFPARIPGSIDLYAEADLCIPI
jgi:hypothetical protein